MTRQDDSGSGGTESPDGVRGNETGEYAPSRAALEEVLDAAPTGIVVLDAEARVERVNERATEILGLSEAEHAGEPMYELGWEAYHEDGTPVDREAFTTFRALTDGEEHANPAVQVRCPDGEVRTLSVASRPVRGDDGEVTEVVVAFTDVSERREARAALEAKNAELERFASVLSHDLRSPLSVARGYVELARETGDLSHLDAVERAHDRMQELIEDLLVLARRGDTIGGREPVSIPEVARAAWETVDPGSGEVHHEGDILEATSSARFEVDATGTVEADESRLHQLLENLFRNAVEHGGPYVTVRVVDLPDCGFAVEDDGPGIDPDDVVRLFDPGAEAEGLGLSIVGAIAEGHGWEVAVGVSEEGGARFEFHTDPDDDGAGRGDERRDGHDGRSGRGHDGRSGRSDRNRGGHDGRYDRDRGDANA